MKEGIRCTTHKIESLSNVTIDSIIHYCKGIDLKIEISNGMINISDDILKSLSVTLLLTSVVWLKGVY